MDTTGMQGEPGRVEAFPGPEGLTLRLRGAIDHPTVRRLDAEIRRIVGPDHAGALVVDLSAVEYCDIALLVLVDDVRRGVRGRFAVRGPDPDVLGMAESTGLREVFAAYRASVALAGALPGPAAAGRCTARDVLLSRTCVELAVAVPTPAGDVDVAAVAERLADRCVDWFEAEAAVLVRAAGVLVAAASTEAARTLAGDGGEPGPVATCLRTGRRVTVPDLAASARSWPSFVLRALQHGMRSLHALPLRPAPGHPTTGVLLLLARSAVPMSAGDLDVAAVFADLTAAALAPARPVPPWPPTGSPATAAGATRVEVEQATGVLAERHGIRLPDARALLERCARTRDLHLGEVARMVVNGDLLIAPVRAP